MKTIILGDIHGRTIWKDILNQEESFDKIVFIGDYVDTHESISGEQQLQNLVDIIQFKKDNMDKVILLFGNHDYHYVNDERYSGFQQYMEWSFKEIFNLNRNLFQMVYQVPNTIILCSHAGISNTWLKNQGFINENEVEFINDLFQYKSQSFKFKGRNPYGDDITQSPIWIRPKSLVSDGIKGYIHVVGHTTKDSIIEYGGNDLILYCIDTLGTSKEYLVVVDNKIEIHKISGE